MNQMQSNIMPITTTSTVIYAEKVKTITSQNKKKNLIVASKKENNSTKSD
jgi:uncharacterized protein (DUF302 family)